MKIKLDSFAYPDSDTINGEPEPEPHTPERPYRRPFLVISSLRIGEYRWQPTIDVESGVIEGWPQGMVAEIYDKPSDDCAVLVDGQNLNDGEYVPRILRPGHDDDDYLVMRIDGEGRIAGWDSAAAIAWIEKRKKEGGAE